MSDAFGLLSDRMGAPKILVVAYHRPNTIRRNFYMSAPAGVPSLGGDAAMASMIEQLLGRPGFHYLWWPGLGGVR